MKKILVIVESPAKIKTLKKFLGSNFVLESSVGHIRDLPEKEFGIDLAHDFEPKYVPLPSKKNVIAKLKQAARSSDAVYLAPDPDREGEAIAWHISELLPPGSKFKRITFNSITKEEVLKAISHPHDINLALVDAQQARRLLDRIVGYSISPILGRRLKAGFGGLSAGRVQSVALKLVVDREKAIEQFISKEFWKITVLLNGEKTKVFPAFVYSVEGKRVDKEEVSGKDFYLIDSQAKAESLLARLRNGEYQVLEVEEKEKQRNPVPPFITSTLQQEAFRHHGFSSKRTMSIAQELYEGIELGSEGPEGLITYMRTDSIRIVPEAIAAARKFIEKEFGPKYLAIAPRNFKSSKSAQDAHEAIRPTSLQHSPDAIKDYLSKDQYKLYSLIWKRFIASQMAATIYNTISAKIDTHQNIILNASGSIVLFPGFLAIYEEKIDEDAPQEEKGLPNLQVGQPLSLVDLKSEQAFTLPPPRFSEASLVKELERLGIGRPSTYATIMDKIQSRDYTIKENKRLKPTELGKLIAQLLEEDFAQIMNVGFTAEMEEKLELIAENEKKWKDVLKEFWATFSPALKEAEKHVSPPKIETDHICPKCGSKLSKIWSKSSFFYGCSKYPDCDYSISSEELSFNKQDYAENFNWEQTCPKCHGPMKIRHGRFGTFLGCANYPECKTIINIPKKGEALVTGNLPNCPAKGCTGNMVQRKSRFGKTFFSCSSFPDCDVIVNRLEDLSTKYADHPKTPYTKKSKKKASPAKEKSSSKKKSLPKKTQATPKGKLGSFSPELTAFLGKKDLSRQAVLKQIWEYIKQHSLQDPKNKRTILPDAALTPLLGSAPIDMFKMSKIINDHMTSKEE